MIDEIRLVPEDDHLEIELRGELAGIFGQQKPVARGDGLEQIKLVAGTRNCLNLLLAERRQVLTPAE